jgi:uncharacterized membrane protein
VLFYAGYVAHHDDPSRGFFMMTLSSLGVIYCILSLYELFTWKEEGDTT